MRMSMLQCVPGSALCAMSQPPWGGRHGTGRPDDDQEDRRADDERVEQRDRDAIWDGEIGGMWTALVRSSLESGTTFPQGHDRAGLCMGLHRGMRQAGASGESELRPARGGRRPVMGGESPTSVSQAATTSGWGTSRCFDLRRASAGDLGWLIWALLPDSLIDSFTKCPFPPSYPARLRD